jgi:hypothetical protein
MTLQAGIPEHSYFSKDLHEKWGDEYQSTKYTNSKSVKHKGFERSERGFSCKGTTAQGIDQEELEALARHLLAEL